MGSCPICRSTNLAPKVTRTEVEREIRIRKRFALLRFDYEPSPAELTDLTEFMHGGSGILAKCSRCGLVIRLEDAPAGYERDTYDPDLLELLYPRYLRSFRAKETQYRPLLPARAEVFEVGSHLGSFLQAAEEWGWRPRGFDIGVQTSRFARRRGLLVQRGFIEDARIPSRGANAIFIWNCFEQLPDPARTLRECYQLLGRNGLLVVRTPNIRYYSDMRPGNGGITASAIRSLAYNNLLGFPYLAGYDAHQLSSLLRKHGFQTTASYDSTVLTVPYPQLSRRLYREIEKIQSLYTSSPPKPAELLSGPWIEIVGRKLD